MASPNSKEEQLSRIRRNQQRSREKKRAHLAELESQVENLRLRLRQCSPCLSSPASASGDEYEQLRHENAARRDMLLNLGWTDEMQQRFIDAVIFAPLNQDLLSNEVEATPVFRPDTSDLPPTEVNVATEPDFSLWMVEGEPINPVTSLSIDTAENVSWLVDNAEKQVAKSQESGTAPLISTRTALSELGTQTSPSSCTVSCLPSGQTQALTAFESSIGRCFLETAVNFRPGDRLLACSEAIRMVLQHNRKGLSLAQLHERMKPGFVMKDDACLVQDNVLFNLLAEISAADSGP